MPPPLTAPPPPCAPRLRTVRIKYRRLLSTVVVALGALLASVLVTAASSGSPAPAAAATPLTVPNWHSTMQHTATPAKGCFTASYPALSWHRVACVAAPDIPAAPAPGALAGGLPVEGPPVGGPLPGTVGGGGDNDYSAQVTGTLTSATGSFPSVTGVSSENSGGTVNAFMVQLNTSPFVTPMCGARPGCQGWEQFLFSNTGGTAGAKGFDYVQYWILNFGAACPAGWTGYGTGTNCFQNGPATDVPPQTIANLAGDTMTGTVSPTTDSAILSTSAGTLVASSSDDVLNLNGRWNIAEFMVGGNGYGQEAVFNPGSTIVVQTVTHNGTTAAPTCIRASYTGETNNLTLVGTAALATGASPAIRSTQSNVPGTAASCAAAAGRGDTHLQTFGGTFYDFQAQGTYTLAETSSMTVQNEQVSGAPTWPNAAVNAAVGTQMGADSVALCANTGSLVVDGAATALADGQTLTLASGDTVARSGNIYTVADPQGDSVVATLNSTYIDVSVGLGDWPEAVSGLLANAPGTDNELEASNGTIIDTPIDFNTLYDVFGNSWAVPSGQSLVSVCNDPEPDVDPTAPLWADELPTKTEATDQALCQSDGVTDPTLLEACTLDVAVLGNGAAQDYVGEAPPVDVGYSEDTSGSGGSSSPSPSPSGS